jgi:pimeloyl-ACP methyl ester carboxylesterase
VNRARRWLTRLVAVVAGLYLAICVLLRVEYRVLLYPAPDTGTTPDAPGTDRLDLVASDGVAVHAVRLGEATPPSGTTIVFFHGNGEVISGESFRLAQQMTRRGYAAVLVEYRGYGQSAAAGVPSEDGLYADAEAVLGELAHRGITPDHLAPWGTSLGSGVAAEMARRGRARSVVLVSPFTSIPDVGALQFPWLPVRLLVPDKYATLEKAPSIRARAYVIHGTADGLVPFAMGKAVAAAIPGCTLVPWPGAGHNDVYLLGGARLLDDVDAFLR